MRTFLISYDLSQPASNKNAIASAIMMLGQSWARPLDQTWYIKAALKDSDIENVLTGLLKDEDGLLVQCVEHEAMLANTQLRWFKQRPQSLAGVETNVIAFPEISAPLTAETNIALTASLT